VQCTPLETKLDTTDQRGLVADVVHLSHPAQTAAHAAIAHATGQHTVGRVNTSDSVPLKGGTAFYIVTAAQHKSLQHLQHRGNSETTLGDR